MAYARRHVGGFVDKPTLATPIDSTFLNAVEAALLKLYALDPSDAQIMAWVNANSRFEPTLIKNAHIDPGAAIAKSKLAALSIVDADVAGAAAIAQSKLALSITNAQIDAAAAIAGSKMLPARVATTVAGLGTAADGALGLLRIGASPYEYLTMIYDAGQGKWVSEKVWESYQTNSPATRAGNEADADQTKFTYTWIENYKSMYDAGLRPQVQLAAAIFDNTGGGQTRFTYRVMGEADGDSGPGANVFDDVGAGLSTVGTTTRYSIGAWHSPVNISAPTKAHAIIVPRLGSDASTTATSYYGSVKVRMVG